MKSTRVVVCLFALVVSVAAYGQNDPAAREPRIVDTITIGPGVGIRLNAEGQALVVASDRQPIGHLERTFVWSIGDGLREVGFAADGTFTRGTALSDTGLVVGQALSPRGLLEPFIWSSSGGARFVSYDPVLEGATATAVNDSGEVVGGAAFGAHSYRLSAATGRGDGPLRVLTDRCASTAVGISRWGESVGAASIADAPQCVQVLPDGPEHAYVLGRDGTLTDLGTLGGARSQAVAINDRGQVAGWSLDGSGASRAFVWSAATGLVNLGTLGGSWSQATAINNLGEVIGVSTTATGDTHGFFWSPAGGMADVGPGAPASLNDLGHVVGTTAHDGIVTAFVWSRAGGSRTLSDNARALDANDRGQVVGSRNEPSGESAVLWQLEVTPAETIDVYEARAGVEAYGGTRTADQLRSYQRWLADARRSLASGDAAGVASSLNKLSGALDDSAAAGAPTRQASMLSGPTTAASTVTTDGGAYNLRVVSDASPDLTDLSSFIYSTTSAWTTDAEKVWALFYWSHILKRQTPPMVLHGMEVTDPIQNFTDYGFTMCSTVTGINQSLYEALGLRHQFWDICHHTVSAVEYDSAFHMVDSSMSNLVTTDDGVTLASVPEAAADSARLVREHSLYSTSPNGFLTGSDSMRNLSDFVNPVDGSSVNGFSRDFCADGLKYRDYYYNWNVGHRYVLNLKEGQSYTRYYRPLGTTADYWVGSEKVTAPDPAQTYEIDAANRFGVRGNGRWSFVPPLSAARWSQAAYRATNIASVPAGLEPAVAGQTAELVYKVSAANAITSLAIQAQFARVDPSASATVAVSVNHGASWTAVADIGSATGASVPVSVNMRNEVSGAYETLVRIQMAVAGGSPDGVVLTALSIDTLTEVNTKALPKLNLGRNEIAVGLDDQSDTMTLWPDLRANRWKDDVYDSRNIAAQSVPTKYTAVVYPAVLSQDAYLTYRFDAPTDITRVVYGGRLYNYAAGSYIDFLHSFDGGATWIPSYRLSTVSKPYDVIHYETVTAIPAGVRTVLVKFLMHNTNTTAFKATGLYAVRMEVDHQPSGATKKPVDVTFRWKEVQPDRSLVERSHRRQVTAFPSTYVIDVGGSDHPVMESLRVSLVDPADPTPYGYGDGVDAGGQKYVYRKRADGTNLAKGKPYTVSRAPSGFQHSPGPENTTILTDGVVGAPVTGSFSYWWGQCWSSGADVDLKVDLGAPLTVGAFRAHLFGYPFWDALKGQVRDRVEIQTSLDGTTFVTRGTLDTSLWKKDIPINHMLLDDETAQGWNFELTTPPVQARFVRYHVTPARILCVSELQVLDRVDYAPFDIRIAMPNAVAPPADTVPPVVTLAAPAEGAVVSGSVAVSANASDNVGVTTVDFSVDGAPIASDANAPYSAGWNSASVANGLHTIGATALDAAGNRATAQSVVTVANPPAVGPGEIVLYAARASRVAGAWQVEADPSAAGGALIRHPNAGAAKVTAASSSPANYFELTFAAVANVPYHLWLRGRADGNNWANDSVFVQFSNVAAYPVGTPAAAVVTLEDCTSCGVSGWGWQDNGFNGLGADVTFTTTGPQTIRIQTREDGLAIDQVMLSPSRFLTTSPGALKRDATIYPETSPTPTAADVMLYAARASRVAGAWQVEADPSAAGGALIRHPNAGAAKVTAASSSPANYFELTFAAVANVPYHLWLRGRADGNSWANDSVFVQFSNVAAYPVGTPAAAVVTLEDCTSCGVSGWGWQDNGFNGLGADVTFTTTGPQTIRIQTREDGLAIDQVMLSPSRFLATSPGALKRDATIYPETAGAPLP